MLGVEEAIAGGKALANDGYKFDVAHTSVLKRAQTTLATVLEQVSSIGPFYQEHDNLIILELKHLELVKL